MVTIELYTEKYKEQLEVLLKDMSRELYGCGTVDTDQFINNHWAIYLAMEDGAVIGFSAWSINHYFGLRKPTAINTYLYVIPQKRNGRAMYNLSVQFCHVAETTNLPIEVCVASEATRRALTRIEGKFLYDVYEYQPSDIAEGYGRLKKHLKP